MSCHKVTLWITLFTSHPGHIPKIHARTCKQQAQGKQNKNSQTIFTCHKTWDHFIYFTVDKPITVERRAYIFTEMFFRRKSFVVYFGSTSLRMVYISFQ